MDMRLLDKALVPEAAGPDAPGAPVCCRFDEFQLDAAARTLTRDGKPVELGSRAFQLLVALVENRDRVVGKDELIRMAWPRSTVVENNLPVAIFALRQAFGGRSYIRTIYGQGYRFAAPVTAGGGAADGKPEPVPTEQPGIAVLPFVTLGGDRERDVFGDGIAEDIIGALSRNRWLRVIARNSSFSFSGAAGAGEVARQLGVRYVLEGSVRHAGGRVRVTAQLNDAASNAQLVSERHDRVLEDIFAVQDEIAARIAAAVRPVLFEAERDRSFRTHPDSIDAWTAYQRGMWYLGRWDDAELRESMAWFGRAMQIEPRYAPGHHGMSRLLCRAGSGYSPVAPADWQRRAERLAEEAVKLDGRDSGAHVALGWARYMRGDRLGAITAARDALDLNPSDAGAYATLGAALVFDGRPAEGIEALQACIDLDPRDARVRIRHMQIGLGLYFMGDMAAAEDQAAAMIRAWPQYEGGSRLMAMALAETGREAEALGHIERSSALSPRPFDNFTHAKMPWYRLEDFRRVLGAFRRAGWQGQGD